MAEKYKGMEDENDLMEEEEDIVSGFDEYGIHKQGLLPSVTDPRLW